MPEATATLNDRIQLVHNVLVDHFIFRKLGICYDYRSSPEDFPRKTLPTADEARDHRPNHAGLGAGMAECTRNSALLFDGYLLRIELGLADPNEERIFDRLIGGLIRIASAAPKGYLVRGLTPDGNGFYGSSSLEAHLFWAFSAWRGFQTAAIAMESQAKIQNIASRWMGRLEQDDFSIRFLAANGPDIDLTLKNWEHGPVFLALLAAARAVTGEKRWQDRYEACAAERERLDWTLPADLEKTGPLLRVQLALHMLAAIETEAERLTLIRARLRDVAEHASRFLDRFTNRKDPILEETPDLDWRALEQGQLAVAPGETEHLHLPSPWRRIPHEAESICPSLEAGLALLLAGDKELAESHAEILTRCLAEVPWDKLWFANALAPALSLHARGAELGLWDEDLLQGSDKEVEKKSLVAPYLADDFDDKHPERAGHTEAPKPRDKPSRSKSRKGKQRGQGRGKSDDKNRDKNRDKGRGKGRGRRSDGNKGRSKGQGKGKDAAKGQGSGKGQGGGKGSGRDERGKDGDGKSQQKSEKSGGRSRGGRRRRRRRKKKSN